MIELIAWSGVAPFEPLLRTSGHAEGLSGWFAAIAETTLAAGETAVLAVAESGRAGLPLAIGPHGARALTAPYTTRYVPALPDVDVAYGLGRRAGTFCNGALRLDGIDPSEPGMAAFLDGLKRSGLAVAPYQGFANWSESATDFDVYWQRRPSRLKATVRRKLAAGARFTLCRDDFEPALAIYEEIRRDSWKGPEPHPAFLPVMVRRLAREGALRMGILEAEGRAVAAQIWLVHGGRGTIFKLVHREDAAALSPGTLLTWHMIQACLREGVQLLDFGRGDDTYKRDWMNTRTTRLGVIAADWRKGLKTIATDVLPTLAARAWRRHFAGNCSGSAAVQPDGRLAGEGDGRTVEAAEASR